MTTSYQRVYTTTAVIALGIAAIPSARADVTLQQQTTMNAAGIKITTTSVERTTADKQRRDTETRCGGFMSLLCGDAKSGQIVRLDREVEWQLQPKKKSYLETQFPTPAERALAQQKLQETLDKMKQCMPAQPQKTAQSVPDTSGCELSAPKLDVKQTDEHAMVAGHDARKSSVIISQTCTDKQSGDICELDYGLDVWLTQDDISGVADRQAFLRAYLKAQGLDENNPEIKGAVQQFMSQYASTMRELSANAASFKGYPLRTTFSFAIGGEHCGRAQQATQSAGNRGSGTGFGRAAADAISGKLSGFFARKGVDAGASAELGQASTNAAAGTVSAAGNSSAGSTAASSSAPQSLQVMAFTTETTSIDTAPIPADQFEIPTGWMREEPKAAKNQEFTCPATGK